MFRIFFAKFNPFLMLRLSSYGVLAMEKGRIQIYSGEGHGKSPAALGRAIQSIRGSGSCPRWHSGSPLQNCWQTGRCAPSRCRVCNPTSRERLIDVNEDYKGMKICITGQFRSYNRHEERKNRLVLSVFAREIEFVDLVGNSSFQLLLR